MAGTGRFFFKASDAVLSHCTCVDPPAVSCGQLDCPWCGCGWLMSCLDCGKAFTFAEVRVTDIPLVEFARRDAASRGLDVSDKEIAEWVDGMADTLDHFEVGDIVVYLDGFYWKHDATDIVFGGQFASHALKRLPHAEAWADPGHLARVLGDKDYWLGRERPDRE